MKYPNYLSEYIEDNKRLRAELADLNYHYECAITDRDVANSELSEANDAYAEMKDKYLHRAERAEAAIARVRELYGHFVRCPDVTNQTIAKSIREALEGNEP